MLALDLGQPPLVAEQGEQGTIVAAGQHLHRALAGPRAGAGGGGVTNGIGGFNGDLDQIDGARLG